MASVAFTTEKGFLTTQLAPFLAILQLVGHSSYLTRARWICQQNTDDPEKRKLNLSVIIRRYFIPFLYDIWTLSFIATFILINVYRIYCFSAAGIPGILDSFIGVYCKKKDKIVLTVCLTFVATAILSRYLFRAWIGITGSPFSQANVGESLRTSGLWRCHFVNPLYFAKYINIWITVVDNLAFLSGCLTMLIITMICLSIGIVFRKIGQQLETATNPNFAHSTVMSDSFWRIFDKHLRLSEEVVKLDAPMCWIVMVYYSFNLMSALNFIGAVKQSTADELGETLFSALLMTFRSIFVQEQAQAFLPMLSKGFEQTTNKQQRSIIKNHIDQLQSGRVGFTVAGIFSINRLFVVTLIGGFVTYAFIILELGDKNLSKSDIELIRNIINQELLNVSSIMSRLFVNSTAR